MKPLWMVFNNCDPLGDKIFQIFKQGDGMCNIQMNTMCAAVFMVQW